MIYNLCLWTESTGLHQTLTQSSWMFPALEAIHLCSLALFGGTELFFNLGLMGFGLKEVDPRQFERMTRPWAILTFLILLISGSLLFTAEPMRLYDSDAFRWKVIFLSVWAAVSTANRLALSHREPRLKIGGAASLLFWFLTALAGRWIGFS